MAEVLLASCVQISPLADSVPFHGPSSRICLMPGPRAEAFSINVPVLL